jgi:hypothetical protein
MRYLPSLVVALAVSTSAPTVRAQSQAVADLPRATTCSTKSTMAVNGGNVGISEITVSSDGGWCWINLWATRGSLQYVPNFKIAQAPSHGELALGEVNKRERVAYRPKPGYIGEDAYILMDTTTNSERRVTISVVK